MCSEITDSFEAEEMPEQPLKSTIKKAPSLPTQQEMNVTQNLRDDDSVQSLDDA